MKEPSQSDALDVCITIFRGATKEATEKIVRNLLVAKDMTYERIAQVTDISVADVARIADK